MKTNWDINYVDNQWLGIDWNCIIHSSFNLDQRNKIHTVLVKRIFLNEPFRLALYSDSYNSSIHFGQRIMKNCFYESKCEVVVLLNTHRIDEKRVTWSEVQSVARQNDWFQKKINKRLYLVSPNESNQNKNE